MSEKRRDERTCDLCGRRLRDKYGRPYAFAIWCHRCLTAHPIYPNFCTTCEGYHFAPGITDVDEIEHVARLAQLDSDKERFDQRIREEQQKWKDEAPERELAENARRIRERIIRTSGVARIQSNREDVGARIRAKFLPPA